MSKTLILLVVLVLLAAGFHLLLAGAGVVRLAIQFPARRRLDPADLARYFRATDLKGGFRLYPLLGAGGPGLTWVALGVALASSSPSVVTVPLLVSSALALLHAVTTTRAAPVMMRIGRTEDEAAALSPLIERFVRWSWPRTVLQVATAGALVWTLVSIGPPLSSRAPLFPALLLLALGFESILAGVALDQVVVHLPARRLLGDAAYAAYLRGADLRAGHVLFPVLGLGSNLLLVLTFASSVLLGNAVASEALLGVAVAGGVAALLVTARAVPAANRLRKGSPGEAPTPLLDRIVAGARWRAPFLWLAFACLLAVLAFP